MSAVFDLYQAGGSWLHRMDARVKLVTALLASVVILTQRNLWFTLAALGLILLVAASAGILATVWRSLRLLWGVMAMIALFTALLTPLPGEAWLALGPVHLSAASLLLGVTLALRIGALAGVVLVWLITTSQSATTRSLVGLGLPYSWGMTLAMALSQLPALADTYRRISDAQKARALELDRGALLVRLRALIPIAVAMVIASLRSAEALSRSLASRGFGSHHRRSDWQPLCMRPSDWLVLGILLAAFAGYLVWRCNWGLSLLG
ncbi:MAG: energy-coupling factor transporter transmembrane protein EcfT [Chloroflexi bacterium]|nr:energy-coupling factor transporter transmembrane protein EcfT [Chloroflexota bacterium]